MPASGEKKHQAEQNAKESSRAEKKSEKCSQANRYFAKSHERTEEHGMRQCDIKKSLTSIVKLRILEP
jgi:hypothetical protein